MVGEEFLEDEVLFGDEKIVWLCWWCVCVLGGVYDEYMINVDGFRTSDPLGLDRYVCISLYTYTQTKPTWSRRRSRGSRSKSKEKGRRSSQPMAGSSSAEWSDSMKGCASACVFVVGFVWVF